MRHNQFLPDCLPHWYAYYEQQHGEHLVNQIDVVCHATILDANDACTELTFFACDIHDAMTELSDLADMLLGED